jgi:hypothetical protein
LSFIDRKHLAFITRIWVEPREIDDGEVIWRGTVELVDVQGQETAGGGASPLPLRRAFNRLEDLIDFLRKHMEQAGIPIEQRGK